MTWKGVWGSSPEEIFTIWCAEIAAEAYLRTIHLKGDGGPSQENFEYLVRWDCIWRGLFGGGVVDLAARYDFYPYLAARYDFTP